MSKGKKHVAVKEVKKSKKHVSAERENIGTGDYSDTTNKILESAKKLAHATVKQLTPGTLRLYVGDSPIARITGLTRKLPSVNIRPKLRGDASKKFSTVTGIQVTKPWKCVGSTFRYTGDKPQNLLIGLAKFFSRAHKIVA
jgi:hypothetical protein